MNLSCVRARARFCHVPTLYVVLCTTIYTRTRGRLQIDFNLTCYFISFLAGLCVCVYVIVKSAKPSHWQTQYYSAAHIGLPWARAWNHAEAHPGVNMIRPDDDCFYWSWRDRSHMYVVLAVWNAEIQFALTIYRAAHKLWKIATSMMQTTLSDTRDHPTTAATYTRLYCTHDAALHFLARAKRWRATKSSRSYSIITQTPSIKALVQKNNVRTTHTHATNMS